MAPDNMIRLEALQSQVLELELMVPDSLLSTKGSLFGSREKMLALVFKDA